MAESIDLQLEEAGKLALESHTEEALEKYCDALNKELEGDGSINSIRNIDCDHILEFTKALYSHAVKNNTILPPDAEGEEEEEEEESSEGDEEFDNENEEADISKNTKFYQFNLDEEDDIDMDESAEEDAESEEDSDDDLRLKNITDFHVYLQGDIFSNILIITEDLLNLYLKQAKQFPPPNEISLKLVDIYVLNGETLLESENFNDSILNFKEALKILYQIKKDSASPDNSNIQNSIIDIHLKICETLKWDPSSSKRYSHFLKKTIKLVQQRLKENKSNFELITSDKTLLENLKEDLADVDSSAQDIRIKHPEFDSILKRALGQLTGFEGDANDVNDLSTLVTKKRKKRKD